MIVDGQALSAAYLRAASVVRPKEKFGPPKGVHLSCISGLLSVVGTDGHRLVVSEVEATDAPELPRGLEQVVVGPGLTPDWRGPVKVELTPYRVSVSGEALPLVEAPDGFVDWRGLQFCRPSAAVTVPTAELLSALKDLGLHRKPPEKEYQRPLVRLHAASEKGMGWGLRLQRYDRRGEWTGDVEVFLPGESDGSTAAALFQGSYVYEAAKAIETANVTLSFRPELNPLTVAGGRVRVVVMPRIDRAEGQRSVGPTARSAP